MKRNSILFFIILYSFVSQLHAAEPKILLNNSNTLKVQVISNYVLGDGDTRVDARNVSLQEAKRIAAELAGSYVQTETVVENNSLKKNEIILISSALMSTKVVAENLTVTSDNRTRLSQTVELTIDKRSVMAKFGILKNDKNKKQQLTLLEKENAQLRKELSSLNTQLTAAKSNVKSSTIQNKLKGHLVERRDVVIGKLVQNESSIRKVFKRGSLLSMAKKSSIELDKAKRDIDANVFTNIVQNTKILLGEPKFNNNGDGTYNIELPINWKMPEKNILQTVNKYFWGYKKKPIDDDLKIGWGHGKYVNGLEIVPFYNIKESKKKVYSDKLLEYMRSKVVTLEVSAENYKVKLFLASAVNDDKNGIGDYYAIHFNTNLKPSILMDPRRSSASNPIVLKNIPATVLEQLTGFDAKIVIN